MVPRQSWRHPAEKVSDLDFAEDIVELKESLEKVQSQLNLLSLTAKEVGLHINTTKTKLISCNIPTRVFSSMERISRTLKIFNILLVHWSTGKDIKCRKSDSMECILEIGSCLEVS